MRKLLAANFTRLRKAYLFWGAMLLHIAFGLFRIYTIYEDQKRGYQSTLDEALFTYILIEGLIMAVFIAVFLGTEYSDGAIRNKLAVGHDRGGIYLANLITVAAVCLLFIAVYLLAVLAAGIPVLGGPALGAKPVLITLGGTLAASAAFCSLYTLVGMTVSRKSTGCIICILLFFGMMVCSTYTAARLDASEEHLAVEMVDGEMVSHMEPNPRYPTERQRAVYQVVFDLLPTGQATQYVMMDGSPLKMSLYSCAIVLAAAAGGMICFRRKDIK